METSFKAGASSPTRTTKPKLNLDNVNKDIASMGLQLSPCRDTRSASQRCQELNLDMTKDLFNRIKKGRHLAPRGKELADTLPRVTDIFTKHGEVLFPEEPRPYVEPKDPIELLKE